MTKPDLRARQLAAIHVRAKQVGLAGEDYRAMLHTVARVRSARDLDDAGRRRVLDHLNRGASVTPDRAPLVSKIRAQLHAAGRGDAYADGVARRMFHVERYPWCTPAQLTKLVAALAIDAKRRARQAAQNGGKA